MRPGLVVVLFCAVGAAAAAAEVVFASGAVPTALIELFTSEGCSSCPPAERWLTDRRADAGLWRDFVPVAWHVTYWDQLGWPDRWAQPAFTERQRAYAEAWRRDSMYTPCFVRDGREWQPGRAAGPPRPAGVLQASYDIATGDLAVVFRPAVAPGRALEVHAVQLGGGLVSSVQAGENAGVTLQHEFVALAVQHRELGLQGDAYHAALHLPVAADSAIPRRALAVWVTRRGELTPLQATGGWLEP